MNDTMRKRLAAAVLGLSLVGGTALTVTTSPFESAWSSGNSQPPSGVFLAAEDRFGAAAAATAAGANETHTGNLTGLGR